MFDAFINKVLTKTGVYEYKNELLQNKEDNLYKLFESKDYELKSALRQKHKNDLKSLFKNQDKPIIMYFKDDYTLMYFVEDMDNYFISALVEKYGMDKAFKMKFDLNELFCTPGSVPTMVKFDPNTLDISISCFEFKDYSFDDELVIDYDAYLKNVLLEQHNDYIVEKFVAPSNMCAATPNVAYVHSQKAS